MNSLQLYFMFATALILLAISGFGEEPPSALTYLNWKANPDAGKTPRNTGSINHPEAPDAKHFKVDILSPELFEPMEFCMLPSGTILICERKGALREYNFTTRETRLVTTLPVAHKQGHSYACECGFLGLIPDPDFLNNNYLYIYYSVISKNPSTKNSEIHRSEDEVHRLSRFVYKDGELKIDSEVTILDIPTDRKNTTCHEAGSMAFGPDGSLYLATGDNTNPFWKDASPMNPDSRELDARRSSGNSNDLRGAILRIKINPDGSYSIPPGNLFKTGTPKTRPEIYAMGLRNPYRITVNQKTGTLYWSEVSPDKNPTGEEINQAKQAGFFGWPFFIGDNLRFITPDNVLTDSEKVINTSPFNTGLTEIPLSPVPPLLHYNRGCAIIGGMYHYNKDASKFSLPPHYDNCLFFGDWNRSWIQLIRLDENENKVAVENFPINFKFRKVIDFFFHDGELYVLEFGDGWFNTKGGRMSKISYSPDFNQQANPESDQRIAGMDLKSRGTTLIQNATCLSCHNAQDKIIGPSFVEMAAKYKQDEETIKLLVGKVKTGGGGVWGPIPMPAHPQYNDMDIREMIDAVLATKNLSSGHKQ